MTVPARSLAAAVDRLHALAERSEAAAPEALAAVRDQLDREASAVREGLAALERRCAELAQRAEAAERRADAEARAHALAVAETAQLRARLGEVTRTLQSIVDSRAWKLVHLYRATLKERLLPAGSRRRALYNRLLRTGELRRPDPAAAPAAPLPQALAWRVVRERFLPPPAAAEAAEPLAATVSVVMPTLNAGADLRVVLERLRAQQGLPPIEIVAVDSGSTDGTLALCERFGVTVVPYPGGPFNHGVARNAGAAVATGEYLVFMSQDAIPVGTGALAGFVRALRSDPLLAAASARQVPRSDADLFSCWQLWCYREKVLGYRADTVVSVARGELAGLGPAERHRAAQLDNVFACVRRSVFEEHRFRPRVIAEDLDLGLRLLDAGYRIGFMSSVAAIHSHTRPPAYHLRRSFVEWLALVDLLGYPTRDWPEAGGAAMAPAIAAAVDLYRRVGAAIAAMDLARNEPPAVALERFREALSGAPTTDVAATDASLEALLAEIVASAGPGPLAAAGSTGDAMLAFLGSQLAMFAEFVARRPPNPELAGELRAALFKLCAETIGHCLADLGLRAERHHPSGSRLAELTAVLGRGI